MWGERGREKRGRQITKNKIIRKTSKRENRKNGDSFGRCSQEKNA